MGETSVEDGGTRDHGKVKLAMVALGLRQQ